jgi:hypothetical protein
MLRTTNAAGRIRDESLMNLGGRGMVKVTLQNSIQNMNGELTVVSKPGENTSNILYDCQ